MRKADRERAPSSAEALAQHYAEAAQVAAYLEAEWSDYLLAADSVRGDDERFGPVPPTFYVEVAQKIAGWVAATGTHVRRACDVGGATGRVAYELARRLNCVDSVTLIEPAPVLARWARRLLLDGDAIDEFPVVQTRSRTGVAVPACRPPRAAGASITVLEQGVADIDPVLQFELVCCLNVVDRAARPAGLVDALAARLRPGGMLVLASPLSFDARFTPDRADWVEDLEELLPNDRWKIVGRSDVLYELRRHTREKISYLSQVVAAIER